LHPDRGEWCPRNNKWHARYFIEHFLDITRYFTE
jgi:hypothetical protein